MTTPAAPARGLDPEAEQEVDFAKYVRLLAVRWWLLAAGVVAGAVIGYLVSLGGSQVYSASATVYLGQPYTPTGGALVQNIQTNPSAVATAVGSAAVQNDSRQPLHDKGFRFRQRDLHAGDRDRRFGEEQWPGQSARQDHRPGEEGEGCGVRRERARRRGGELEAPRGLCGAEDRQPRRADRHRQRRDQVGPDGHREPGALSTDQARPADAAAQRPDRQDDERAAASLAKGVERPKVYTHAASHKVTARSRRNTVVIAALIGLILGALAALLWDTVVPRLAPRNGD